MANTVVQYQGLAEPLSEVGEKITPDKWLPQVNIPQAAWSKAALYSVAVNVPQAAPTRPLVPTLALTQQTQVPPRAALNTLYYLQSSTYTSDIVVPVPSLDAWFQATQRPRWDVVHSQYLYQSHASSPLPPVPSLGSWLRETARPVWDRPHLSWLLYQPFSYRVNPPPPSFGWFVPTQQPLFDTPRRQNLDPTLFRHNFIPVLPNYTSWMPIYPSKLFDVPRLQYLYPTYFRDPYGTPSPPSDTVDSWFMETQRPVRDVGRTQYLYNPVEVGPTSPIFPETVSVDRWHPTYPDLAPGSPHLQYLQARGTTSPIPIAGSTGKFVDAWYRPLSTPVWSKPAPQYLYPFSVMPARTLFPERITVDKWHGTYPDRLDRRVDTSAYLAPASTRLPYLPIRPLTWQPTYPSMISPRPNGAYLLPALALAASPRPHVITVDRWFSATSTPLYARPRWQYLYPDESPRSLKYLVGVVSAQISGYLVAGETVSGVLVPGLVVSATLEAGEIVSGSME